MQKVSQRLASMTFEKPELKKALVELAFDVQHFRCYVQLYKNTKLQRVCPAAYQAVLYSMLLHFRLLLDFFYGKPKKDDCSVRHFRILQGFSTAFPASLLLAPPDKVSFNLHKRLAHLTATRWEQPRPSMDHYEKHFDQVNKLLNLFQAALPADMRMVFISELNKWENRHPATMLGDSNV
jgi:hypothetical protein